MYGQLNVILAKVFSDPLFNDISIFKTTRHSDIHFFDAPIITTIQSSQKVVKGESWFVNNGAKYVVEWNDYVCRYDLQFSDSCHSFGFAKVFSKSKYSANI